MNTDPSTELEQLRLEVARLKAERDMLLTALRSLQKQIQDANASAMGIVNALQGTKR